MITNAYLKYAMALLMEENGLSKESDVTFAHIKKEINRGLDSFCVKPKENFSGKTEIKFTFVNETTTVHEKYLTFQKVTNCKLLFKFEAKLPILTA